MFSTTNSSLDRKLLHDLAMKLWLRHSVGQTSACPWTCIGLPKTSPLNAQTLRSQAANNQANEAGKNSDRRWLKSRYEGTGKGSWHRPAATTVCPRK
uniref:Uncharacterized protein n=1 Tax=Lepeophtheirus salmonis TaxID=72036 RepID=A0A0K2SYV0_LEPSM